MVATWNNVLRQTADDRGPTTISAVLAGVGGTQAQIRFHYYNAFWAWWWAVDDLAINSATCNPSPTGGGLVIGNVSDSNTGTGLNGATVKNMPDGDEATTVATPQDPNVPDGFYAVFAGSGPQPFEASDGKYVPLTLSTNVIPNSTVRLDFALAAGWLAADQSSLTSKVLPGLTDTQTLNIINSGDAPGSFEIQESNAPLPTVTFAGHFASKQDIKRAEMRIPKGWKPEGAMSAKGLPPLFNAFKPKETTVINAPGDVLTSYPLSFGPPPAGLPYGLLLGFEHEQHVGEQHRGALLGRRDRPATDAGWHRDRSLDRPVVHTGYCAGRRPEHRNRHVVAEPSGLPRRQPTVRVRDRSGRHDADGQLHLSGLVGAAERGGLRPGDGHLFRCRVLRCT